MDGNRAGDRAALTLAFALLAVAIPAPPGAAPGSAPEPPAQGAARLLFDLPLDLNREPAAQLEALPGIGPTRARAIVAGRPYCDVGALRRVAGIGPITLARIRSRLTVGAGCRGRGD